MSTVPPPPATSVPAASTAPTSRASSTASGPGAAVDVGSNSVRLLVVDADGARIMREMRVTRLAAGVDRTGHLDDAALARTLAVMADFRAIWSAHGVTDRVRIAATSAVRDAADRERFFEGVRATTGVEAEVLSGTEEAALAFAGATGAIAPDGTAAVLDIGGGSTELIVGRPDGSVAGSVSLQLGCVRLTERHLHADPPTDDQLVAARTTVAELLDQADRELAAQGASVADADVLVSVAGTATTLAALHLGLPDYEETRIHGTHLPTDRLRAITDQLARERSAARATHGPMQPGREDVILGGALVLDAVVHRYGLDGTVVSEADNLDGLAASLG